MAMSPGMRMMMLQRSTSKPNRSEYSGDDGRRMIGYDRNYERERNTYGDGEDMAYRRRDRKGRYMMDDDEPESRYYPRGGMNNSMRMGGYMPPASPENMMRGNSYGDIYAEGTIYAPGAMNRANNRDSAYSEPVTEEKARKWTEHMKGADGSTGAKWRVEQTEPFRNQHCPDCNKWEFFVAMNAMYADYCTVARQFGCDKPEYYALLAKAFLKDEDAGPNKLAKYMETIPKH